MNPSCENLTFEGAGIFGISYIGALSVLDEHHILDGIKRYSGTSSGSLIAALLSMDCSIKKLHDIMLDTDWGSFLDTSCCCTGLFNTFYKFGYNIGKRKERVFRRILDEHTGIKDITFKQAYDRYNKELYVCTVNINLELPVYFSHEYSPDLSIYKALHMSTAFPYVFSPVKYNGHYHVDGGIMENYPMEIFNDTERSLGLKIISSDDTHRKMTNIYNYTTRILSSILRALDDKDTIPYKDQTIFIKIPKQGLLTSVLDVDTVLIDHHEYFRYGVECTKQYIKKKKGL
jgi:predicted acylesterase/phospholipase RssA